MSATLKPWAREELAHLAAVYRAIKLLGAIYPRGEALRVFEASLGVNKIPHNRKWVREVRKRLGGCRP